MRLLFELDKNDHAGCTHTFIRNSARGIILRGGKVAMIHSIRYDYYKFPGGGIKRGEDPKAAMMRETKEEAGLVVIPGSIREYGYVHRVQRSDMDETERFIQDNYYYLCDADNRVLSQHLDDYEAEEQFTLEFVDPKAAIEKNRTVLQNPRNQVMVEREARVLELLIKEGFFAGLCR